MCEQIVSGILVAAAEGGITVRIVLIGYRGTGKTTIGRSLARELDLPFVDTDILIEAHEGKTISEIFRQEGEAGFRKIEKEVIRTLPQSDVVIATGGGAVLDPDNVESLRAESTVVLLSADPSTIVRRIQKSGRPPLTAFSLEEEVRYLVEFRTPYYLRAADYCLDTGNQKISATVRILQDILKGEGIPEQEANRLLERIPPLQPEDRHLIQKRLTGGCPLRLYAVIGNPIAHSKSPPLFNALFSRYRLPHRYIRMASPYVQILLEIARTLNFRGLSVTIPHKQTVMEHLDRIDPVAESIGAVNTIVHCGETLHGYNTDWLGIRRPLSHLGGKRVVVLGAGGVAAAAIYACRDLDMQITVLNRTPERGAALAERFGCAAAPLAEFPRFKPEVVINATPVGMEPDTQTPVPVEWLRREMTIFDLVYTPPLTPLLRGALEKGCPVISGQQVFLHQAREQFYLFTGISPPISIMQELIP
ncbi:MAG: shikimate dehydrogenase [Methanomicrobiales archaeon]|nr:shikimate dehydrogenase [Methanomicrobiales archaeon]